MSSLQVKSIKERYNHTTRAAVINTVLLFAVAIPAIYCTRVLYNDCPSFPRLNGIAPPASVWELYSTQGTLWEKSCVLAVNHPLAYVNVVFFFNVCILFWIISLIQNSTWLIDPYWTIIPVMIGHAYLHHPKAFYNSTRSKVSMVLLWLWAIRLTHSYFRREQWNMGAREDWRFADFRVKFSNHWWWMQFFLAYVSQQIFLVGITLPLLPIHQYANPWGFVDVIASVICLVAIVVAYFSDTQLYEFMKENEAREARGDRKIPLLNSGLWYYSRHPNYFGEQLWWWGLGVFAWELGFSWMLIGPLINSLCLAAVTVMVEERMLRNKDRVVILLEYFRTTSPLIPFFKMGGGVKVPNKYD